jgi:hypothetical protein
MFAGVSRNTGSCRVDLHSAQAVRRVPRSTPRASGVECQSQKVSQLWGSGAVPYCTDVIAS